MTIPPKITHVAIRFDSQIYSLPAPNRHHHVIRHICETTGVKCVDAYGENQGFLDETGRYLTRAEALVVAMKTGQCRADRPICGDVLFSENLW